MTVHHTPTQPFGPWSNDNGLICGVEANGVPSFDIFDACTWPGSDEDGQKIAAFIHKACNRDAVFEELVAAVEEIAKGDKPFHLDPHITRRFEHATNYIDEMKAIACAALAKARETEGG